MTTREPVVISNKGKVALSTRSRWNLVHNPTLWSDSSLDKFDATLKRICEEHEWVDVWALGAAPGLSKEIDVKVIGGNWKIYRYTEESNGSDIDLLELVSFLYHEDNYALEWPFYYRGEGGELIKVMPHMPFYDEMWSYHDTGMVFTLDEVRQFWHDMYRRFTARHVIAVLENIGVRLDWQGRIARLIKRLIDAGDYSDAAEVAYCASERASDLYESDARTAFNEIAARLFALDKS